MNDTFHESRPRAPSFWGKKKKRKEAAGPLRARKRRGDSSREITRRPGCGPSLKERKKKKHRRQKRREKARLCRSNKDSVAQGGGKKKKGRCRHRKRGGGAGQGWAEAGSLGREEKLSQEKEWKKIPPTPQTGRLRTPPSKEKKKKEKKFSPIWPGGKKGGEKRKPVCDPRPRKKKKAIKERGKEKRKLF